MFRGFFCSYPVRLQASLLPACGPDGVITNHMDTDSFPGVKSTNRQGIVKHRAFRRKPEEKQLAVTYKRTRPKVPKATGRRLQDDLEVHTQLSPFDSRTQAFGRSFEMCSENTLKRW